MKETIVAELESGLRKGTSGLPSLPRSAADALRLASNPGLDPVEVIALAENDPLLAARFLAVANSVLYARGTVVSSLRIAVARLGLQAARDVIYQAVYANALFDVPSFNERVRDVFRHSVVCARAARRIDTRLGRNGDDAFLAALLHDMGRARCLKIATKMQTSAIDELDRAVDQLHSRAGAELATAWGLPEQIVEVCELHHTETDRLLVLVVQCADVLAHRSEHSIGESDEQLDAALARLGLDELAAPLLAELAEDQRRALSMAPSSVQRPIIAPRHNR